jgi:hypothetical protein
MKTVKLLATLAILAGAAANAVTVSFTGGATSATNTVPPGGAVGSPTADTPYGSLTFTNGGSTVIATAFYFNEGVTPNKWMDTAIRFLTASPTNGIGVTQLNTNQYVQGAQQEYVLLDFGGGTTSVSTLQLYLSAGAQSTQYFTYAWLNAGQAPTNNSTSPAVPLTAYGTGNVNASAPSPSYSGAGSYSFNMALTGSGRYLLLGATNHGGLSAVESNFLVQSVTYTQVADGASTLALLGAAVGALGFASSRRRR